MNNRKTWALTAAILVITVVLSMGVAYARYQTQIQNDLTFRAKQTQQLTIASQVWSQQENAYILTFTMGQISENSRIYLAVSEGITAPEQMQVILTLPGEEMVQATAQAIPQSSILATAFGAGYVFRFLDADGKEITFDLTTDEYMLSVIGLDGAAEQTSLLRLFVEQAP